MGLGCRAARARIRAVDTKPRKARCPQEPRWTLSDASRPPPKDDVAGLTREGNAMEDKMLYTLTDVAAALSVGRSKVYELVRCGALPSVRIGGSRRHCHSNGRQPGERLRTTLPLRV